MTESDGRPIHENVDIGVDDVDLSTLVGHEITLFTEQFQGKPLKTKVVMISGGVLSLDRSGAGGTIDNLITNQKAIIQFFHKGQRISVDATLKRTGGGKCTLVLGDKLVWLTRRKYKRYDLTRPVRCAVMPSRDMDGKRLNKLRWMETDSVNFSSGGLMLCLQKQLNDHSYLLLNLDVTDFDFPALIIAQVRYAYPTDSFRFFIGIEFIVNDVREKHFAPTTIKRLPPVVFEYDASRRSELNRELAVHLQKLTKQER